MAHAFSSGSLSALVAEIERLLVRTAEQEARLSTVSSLLPQDSAQPDNPATIVRHACGEEREQRLLLLSALNGVDSTDPSRGGPLVLVVNDSPEEREATGEVLESDGLRVITASNGLEAVLATHSARPAVVVMDVQMSIVDGVEAARLLKADAATRRVPLIAHTSAADFGNEAASLMFEVILPKPTSAEVLTQTVRYFIG